MRFRRTFIFVDLSGFTDYTENFGDDITPETMLKNADSALYKAKQAGRKRVESARSSVKAMLAEKNKSSNK